ncbi:hypothetical protein P170DRAFT_427952 [Aspergillus steynii IBT 23096]|uniref:Uncharacterized protein n=1 Tax=Aspergillus steynii IBT 23096 TaxID=1392250 RepID=A0A2I2G1A1_9EURO|nr:uncharacterized protein P170DRAFT_427952 [Aspergillus steynii IBT 23096]PLB46652.1 hypothetical protein P170DRAFT_427952 [Aspergillus steynii IBT 23096]
MNHRTNTSYFCLIRLTSDSEFFDSEWMGSVITALEQGHYTIWRQLSRTKSPLPKRSDLFRVDISSDILEPKHHDMVVKVLRARMLRNQKIARIVEAQHPGGGDSVVGAERPASGGFPLFCEIPWMGDPDDWSDVEEVEEVEDGVDGNVCRVVLCWNRSRCLQVLVTCSVNHPHYSPLVVFNTAILRKEF